MTAGAIEAVSANAATGNADTFYKVVKLSKAERCQFKTTRNLLHHAFILRSAGRCIQFEILAIIPLEVANNLTRNQLHIALR